MMKVALYEAYDGALFGNQRYITMLSRYFSGMPDAEFQVYLPSKRGLFSALTEDGACPRVAARRGHLHVVLWLFRVLGDHGPDVILSNNHKSLLTILPAALLRRIPFVWYIKDSSSFLLADILCFLFAKRVLVISRESFLAKNRMLRKVFNNKVYVLPIGIYTSRFTGLSELKADPGGIHVLMVSSLVERKGVHIALDAMARLSENQAKIDLTIIGSTEDSPSDYVNRVRKQAQDLSNVTMLNWSDNIPGILAQFDIVILPSFSEGTPRAIVEAMAAGRPVIATRVGGIPSLIEDGRTGLLIDAGNAASLAEAILKLSQSPELLRQMGQSARAHALLHHEFDRHMESLMHYLESCRIYQGSKIE
jgi:glycosyltransferase involved in cell wall biosynthesis